MTPFRTLKMQQNYCEYVVMQANSPLLIRWKSRCTRR